VRNSYTQIMKSNDCRLEIMLATYEGSNAKNSVKSMLAMHVMI
jgi:hypothetical protein